MKCFFYNTNLQFGKILIHKDQLLLPEKSIKRIKNLHMLVNLSHVKSILKLLNSLT